MPAYPAEVVRAKAEARHAPAVHMKVPASAAHASPTAVPNAAWKSTAIKVSAANG